MSSQQSPLAIGIRLSIMMFLEFFVWGAWYVTVGNYMDANGMGNAIYWAYTVGPIAAIISPFILGMIADRFFASERVLAVLMILGGAALYYAPNVVGENGAGSGTFILLLLLHMLCYMPTLGLTNSIAFSHLKNQEVWFPLVRVFGTLGWIVANIIVSKVLGADKTATPLLVAGGAGVIMGIYSLTLPHTPPAAKGKKITVRDILGLDSLALLKDRSFLVFIVSSLLICIPLAAYYAYAPVFVADAGIANPAFKMSFGQMSEVLFMVLMPLFFKSLGVKRMLLFGMFAWVVRYALFAAGASDGVAWMIIAGILLHGICYDFFFVTGQIYVDQKAGPAIRAQAQGFLVLATQGVGMLVGALISGNLINAIVTGEGAAKLETWKDFWIYPTVAAFVIMVIFMILFKDDPKGASNVSEEDVAKAASTEEMV
ncbi:nucleoside permease [Gimesia aquarii]|uniref:Nucleoside transporter YegT n=1 Tax=Gimesia aquarii TaxID=2527964 RepID=A0A517W334_9PLAN|nr:nucleoside permease [Gimesia aquarii]QDT99647.1 Putative nucleoside transporter YegT [Gimesia aquarii]